MSDEVAGFLSVAISYVMGAILFAPLVLVPIIGILDCAMMTRDAKPSSTDPQESV